MKITNAETIAVIYSYIFFITVPTILAAICRNDELIFCPCSSISRAVTRMAERIYSAFSIKFKKHSL